MYISSIIVENFLENPNLVRESALAADFFSKKNHPGVRSSFVNQEYLNYVKEKISKILNRSIIDFESEESGKFQICLEDDKSWIHTDPFAWSAVLFLNPDSSLDSGTGIFRHIKSGLICYDDIDFSYTPNLDERDWECVTMIGNVFNRLVLFKGRTYHRSLLAGFGNNKSNGRLTQVFFFNTEENGELYD